MKPTNMITQERLKELLYYDPKEGVFTWLEREGRFKEKCDAIYARKSWEQWG